MICFITTAKPVESILRVTVKFQYSRRNTNNINYNLIAVEIAESTPRYFARKMQDVLNKSVSINQLIYSLKK